MTWWSAIILNLEVYGAAYYFGDVKAVAWVAVGSIIMTIIAEVRKK